MKDCLLLVFANKQDIPGGESGFLLLWCILGTEKISAESVPALAASRWYVDTLSMLGYVSTGLVHCTSATCSHDTDRSDGEARSPANEGQVLVLPPFERAGRGWSL